MTTSKNNAYDGKGAVAGKANSDLEQATIDDVTAQAGLDLSAGEVVDTQAKLRARDEDRWELNPDSTQAELR